MADMSLKGWQAPKSRHIRAMGVPTRAVGPKMSIALHILTQQHYICYLLQIAETFSLSLLPTLTSFSSKHRRGNVETF